MSRARKTLYGFTNTAKSLFAGAGLAMGLSKAVSAIVADLKRARQATLDFESEMTELLSLGDNVKNIRAVKAEVIHLSNQMGKSRQEIAGAMFALQSGASDLAATIRKQVLKEAIEMTRVLGGDLRQNVRALTKLMLIYGDSLRDVNHAQNLLAKTSELAEVTLREMAVYYPDVISAAETFGYTMEQVSAAIVVATQRGGKSEKTFTGLRNVFLRLGEAQKLGLKTTGDFIKDLRQLEQFDPDTLKKIFGAESISVIGNLVKGVASLNEHLKTFKGISGDIVQSKLWDRLGDAAFQYAEISKTVKQMKKNIDVDPDFIKKWGDFTLTWDAAQVSLKSQNPSWLRWASGIEAVVLKMGDLQTVMAPWLKTGDRYGREKLHGAEMIANAQASGIEQVLTYIRITKGAAEAEKVRIAMIKARQVVEQQGLSTLGNRIKQEERYAENARNSQKIMEERYQKNKKIDAAGIEYEKKRAATVKKATESLESQLRIVTLSKAALLRYNMEKINAREAEIKYAQGILATIEAEKKKKEIAEENILKAKELRQTYLELRKSQEAEIQDIGSQMSEQLFALKEGADAVERYKLKMLGATDAQLKWYDTIKKQIAGQQKLNDEVEKLKSFEESMREAIKGPEDIYKEKMKMIDKLLDLHRITAEEYGAMTNLLKEERKGVGGLKGVTRTGKAEQVNIKRMALGGLPGMQGKKNKVADLTTHELLRSIDRKTGKAPRVG